jgi:hypothetical protein
MMEWNRQTKSPPRSRSESVQEGKITFQVTVQDMFDHHQGPLTNDIYVDKFDFLDICVTIQRAGYRSSVGKSQIV